MLPLYYYAFFAYRNGVERDACRSIFRLAGNGVSGLKFVSVPAWYIRACKKYRRNDDTVFWFRQRKQMRDAYYRNRARQIPPIQIHLFHRTFPVVISLVFTTEPDDGF
jgi:hypothetical protein